MIKELKNTYYGVGEIKGYELKQLVKSEKGYIYEKTHVETGSTTFEVFKRKENKYYNCISYPSSKSFGLWAWEVQTLERAKEKFNTF